ncbi:MAG TPA: exopolysaccharide biosynthesis polyprenyl glycosylphosphotransferase [Conexibacter sp.]|nr:exopolysaccharide biosynthesis polyprenyl glycosylphosphotransferase [Conexibacter sp.]
MTTVDTGSSHKPGDVGRAAPQLRSRGWASLRRAAALHITEATGPEASLLRDALFRRTLLAGDLLAVTAALLVTTRIGSPPLGLTWYALLVLPAVALGGKLFGLYDRDEALLRRTTLDEVPRLFYMTTLGALAAWLAAPLILDGTLSRVDVVVLWIALLAFTVAARIGARSIALRLSPTERCLFIGDGAAAETIYAKLTSQSGIKAMMVAHIDLDKVSPWSSDVCSATDLQKIRERAQTLDVHRAIIAPRSADAGEMLDLVRTLKAVGIRVSVLPRLLEVVGSAVEFDDLHGVTVMGVRRFDLTRSSAFVKRSFDLVGAGVCLLAVSPLLLLVALAIKLDSRGPILFRQLRVGRHGKRFEMLKFRTMVDDAEQLKAGLADRNEARDGLFKITDDPRVTRVGRLLRASALDELPQLLNVLRGEMSLVGPRPLVLDEDQHIEGWHRRRLELMPGMTGQWQILGATRVPLREMVAIDYLYVANWSLWTDIKILLRTVPHVLGRRGM